MLVDEWDLLLEHIRTGKPLPMSDERRILAQLAVDANNARLNEDVVEWAKKVAESWMKMSLNE